MNQVSESRRGAPDDSESTRRPLIVVADDQVTNLRLMTARLEVLGFDVQGASNGQEAIEACSANPPVLLITDINMPVINGFEVALELRQRQRLRALPRFSIVAWTSCSDQATRRTCAASGMDGFCEKPTHLHALVKELRRLLPGWRPAPNAAMPE